ncbi:glycosyltransferase, partial [Vibrio parahaemolyticus]
QGLPAILDAAEILMKKEVDVNVVFVGDGVAKKDAIKTSQDKKLTNTFFLPRVPMNQVGSLLNDADMLLVHLNDEELFRITI